MVMAIVLVLLSVLGNAANGASFFNSIPQHACAQPAAGSAGADSPADAAGLPLGGRRRGGVKAM